MYTSLLEMAEFHMFDKTSMISIAIINFLLHVLCSLYHIILFDLGLKVTETCILPTDCYLVCVMLAYRAPCLN